jgi:hypothetical protein
MTTAVAHSYEGLLPPHAVNMAIFCDFVDMNAVRIYIHGGLITHFIGRGELFALDVYLYLCHQRTGISYHPLRNQTSQPTNRDPFAQRKALISVHSLVHSCKETNAYVTPRFSAVNLRQRSQPHHHVRALARLRPM